MTGIPNTVFVDADACPVKEEIYKVAGRYGARVVVVANAFIAVPKTDWIERIVVPAGPDVADDWIAERAGGNDVVITADMPLAGRCVASGAIVLAPDGRAWTRDNIGAALATRNLLTDLRSAGHETRGPKPFTARDRSTFLSALDLALGRLKRAASV